MTGIGAVAASALSRRVASQPSSTGRLMSISTISGRSRGRHGDAFGAVDGDQHFVSLPREAAREHVAVHLVVLDQKNFRHALSSPSRSRTASRRQRRRSTDRRVASTISRSVSTSLARS